jgi:hypothetical protein
VDADDIVLLALSAAQQQYAALKLSELQRRGLDGEESADLAGSLRQYLYEKYVYQGTGEISATATERLVAVGGRYE